MKRALDNLNKLGIYLDENKIDRNTTYDRALYKLLLLNKEENEKILGEGILDELRFLFRKGSANPESPIFVDVSKYRPTPKETTDLIHNAGGIAFLAHPYQYAFEDILEMITDIRKECNLDGVEAFHSSFTIDQMITLQEYAKKNKLYISGGSDYHGSNKPGVNLKTGSDNLHISKSILEWLK